MVALKHDVERGGPGDVVHGCCAFLHILTPAHICRSICGAAPVEVGSVRLQASQALASDHVDDVQQPRTRCPPDHRPGEENDTTELKALTLLNRKVTAQVEVNRSC